MRRITFVNRFFAPDLSPTSELLTQLASHFAAEGWRVTAIAGCTFYDRSGVLPARETVGRVAVRRLPVTRLAGLGLVGRAVDYLTFYLCALAVLATRLRRGELVVVNTDPPLIGFVALLAARLRDARLVNWLHDLYPDVAAAYGLTFATGPFGGLLTRLRDVSLRGAALNVAICEAMAERLRAHAPAVPVRVIHNWCDDEAIRPLPAEANPLLTAWGLEERFVVGYSGNLGRAHDWRTIAAAAGRLAGRKDIIFLMIGGGAGMAALQAEVARLGLQSQFQFKPYQPLEILAQTLAVPDLHLVSQAPAFEGLLFPSKLYSAAAAGRAIIAIGDPSGELAALVRGCGEAVAAGDGEALAATIERCADERHRTAAWGRSARAMIDQTLSRERAFAHWSAVVAQLV